MRSNFYHPINLVLLSTAVALSAILLSIYPFIIGALLEAVWLGFHKLRGRYARSGEIVPNYSSLDYLVAPNRVSTFEVNSSDEHPVDAKLEVLARHIDDLRDWQFRLCAELESIVVSARDSFCVKQEARAVMSVATLAEAHEIDTRHSRFADAITGNIDLDEVTAERGSAEWIRIYDRVGRRCLEEELRDNAVLRDRALYESERDGLKQRAEHLLSTLRKINGISSLLSNIICEIDMLTKCRDRVNIEKWRRSPTQLCADLDSVLLHSARLIRDRTSPDELHVDSVARFSSL